MNELNPRDEALSRALAEVEKTRAVMQTVLDNMSAAVCLYDKDHVLPVPQRHVRRDARLRAGRAPRRHDDRGRAAVVSPPQPSGMRVPACAAVAARV
jgi:hypothetical protein